MSDAYEIPPLDGEPTECHALGSNPEGYDAEASTCHNCLDKFTCLPAAIESGLITIALNADREVQQVIDHEQTYAWAAARMQQREDLDGDDVPAELAVDHIPPPEPEPAPAKKKKKVRKKKAVKKVAPVASEEVHASGRKKVAKKKVLKKKPAAVAEAPQEAPKPEPRRRALAETRKDTRPVARSNPNNKLPAPQTVTKEEMVLQLEGGDDAQPKVKLGVPGLRLGWGYQLVRKARAGMEFVVTITENGFMDEDKIYSSLSAAAQNASGTFCRSGNDWFSLVTTQCTSVRDERGNVIARRGSLVVD